MPVKTILLVEDNASDSDLFREALSRANLNHQVHVAPSGRDAVLYLYGDPAHRQRPQRPDLIVLDFRMAGLTGLQLLQMLHNVSRGERAPLPPILAFSSLEDDRRIREAYRLGLSSFIHKPAHAGRFVEMVQQMVVYWLDVNYQPRSEGTKPLRAAENLSAAELEAHPFGVGSSWDAP